MPTHWESRSEPIPGYRLVERLGRGGFGEVWKAEAPGGLPKAIKFVHGEIAGGDGHHAQQELKALERIRGIRHPFILSMERFDIIDGQLMIVMEIADCSLEQRLREYQKQGLPGLPRNELLNYMFEAAEALDLMNNEYDLQHLDIKPQNLFLIGQHVKVADFGLVKDLEGCTASVTGGVTPVYAPPETFDGWVSRTTDQYSLAIVYEELLTGRRPFNGPSARQYMMQHLTSDPDVSPLPPCDRPLVRRALSKDPKERFPSCLTFVEALREAGRTTYSTTSLVDSETDTVKAASGEMGVSTAMGFGIAKPGNECSTTIQNRASLDRAGLKACTQGTLRPTLVVGIGQTGVETIDRLQMKLSLRYGDRGNWPAVRLLGIDVDAGAQRYNAGKSALSREILESTIYCKFKKPNQYFQEWEDLKHLSDWLDPNLLFQISSAGGTNCQRALGRLAFFENYRTILARLRSETEQLVDPSSLQAALSATGMSLRTETPRICVVASMGGGVGSGMFIDLSYLVRRVLLESGASDPDVEGFLIAGVKGGGRTIDLRRINHFALAQDLLDYSQPDASFVATYERDGEAHRFTGAPVKAAYYFDSDAASVPEPRLAAIEDLVAEVVLHEATSAIGKELDAQERSGHWPSHRSIGLFSLSFPLRELLWKTSARLCKDTVEQWLTPMPRRDGDEVCESASKVASQAGFSADAVSTELLANCNSRLSEPVHVLAARIVAEIEQDLRMTGNDKQLDVLHAGLERIKAFLGLDPNEDQAEFEAEPTFERALREATNAVAGELLTPLVESLSQTLDRPGPRLDRARRTWEGFSHYLLTVLDQQQEIVRTEIQRMCRRARQLRERVSSPGPSLGRPVFDSISKRVEMLQEYAEGKIRCRLREQVLQVYLVLRGKLSDWSRDFVRVRQTLEQVTAGLREQVEKRPASLGWCSQMVFPGGMTSLDEAVAHLHGQVGEAATRDLDAWIQASTVSSLGGLWSLCNKDQEFAKRLPATLIGAAMRWLQEGLSETDVASAFFDRHDGSTESQRHELSAFVEWCMPTSAYRPTGESVDAAPPTDWFLLAVPKSESGERFVTLFQSLDGVTQPRVVADGEECTFCRVHAHESLARILPKWLLDSKPLYESACMTRLSPEIFHVAVKR